MIGFTRTLVGLAAVLALLAVVTVGACGALALGAFLLG